MKSLNAAITVTDPVARTAVSLTLMAVRVGEGPIGSARVNTTHGCRVPERSVTKSNEVLCRVDFRVAASC